MNHLVIDMGIRIFELRKQMGLTQNELAERAGMHPQTISSAELGKKSLRPNNIVRLSQALGVSTDYLLTGSRNSSDHIRINSKLEKVSAEKYDRIMRVIDIMLEE